MSKNNEEYHIQEVFYNPMLERFCYRGLYAADLERQGAAVSIWAIDMVAPVPGETKIGTYNLATGEIRA